LGAGAANELRYLFRAECRRPLREVWGVYACPDGPSLHPSTCVVRPPGGLVLKLGRYIRSSQKVCLGVIEATPGSAECLQKISYFVMKCRTALWAPKLLSCFQMSDLLFEPVLAVRVGAAQWEGIGVRHINRLCHFDNVQSEPTCRVWDRCERVRVWLGMAGVGKLRRRTPV
jgi:hypothetical protein